MVSAGATRLDRLGPPGRWRAARTARELAGGAVADLDLLSFQAPALTLFITHTRARALMARLWSARYYGVARQRAGRAKTASGPRRVNLIYHPIRARGR